MISLTELLWDSTTPTNNGKDMSPNQPEPTTMHINCMSMCCAMGSQCTGKGPAMCWIGHTGCR